MKKLLKLARRAAIALGWQHPFFSIPAAKIRFREDAAGALSKTACVTADGIVYFYPPFAEKLKKAELQGLIAHELMHLCMLHYHRRGERDPFLWNIAGDMAINHALQRSGIRLPEGGVLPPSEWEGWNAERIYAELVQDEDKSKQQYGGGGDGGGDEDGKPMPGQGCGVEKPTGERDKGSGDGAGDSNTQGSSEGRGAMQSDASLEREWREISVQAATMERSHSQGQGKGSALVDAITPPEPRVNWGAIVRQGTSAAIAAHGRDAQTWTRRGRRSQSVGPQFPGWQTNAAKCAVVIDTSGSMSDDALAQCVAETIAVSRESGVAIYLVTHDHGVQWADWIKPHASTKDIMPSLRGRGGTDASEAYRRVADAARRIDVFIHLTDGYLFWPEWPANSRKKVVALVGYGVEPEAVPDGARVVQVNLD